jgi:hypothetical protein
MTLLAGISQSQVPFLTARFIISLSGAFEEASLLPLQ